MKCFERAHLFAYAQRMLEAREAAEVRTHLDACEVCRALVGEYERLETVLDEWKPTEPSPWFDARVRQAVKAQEAARASTAWMRLRWGWLATASLAVLVAAVSLVTYRSHRISGPSAPARSAQRPSSMTQPAPQALAESRPSIVAEKKAAAPPVETSKAKGEGGPLLAEHVAVPAPKAANLENPPRQALRAEAQNEAARPVAQSLRPPQGLSLRAAGRPAPPLEGNLDAGGRAGKEREASAQPAPSASGGGALARNSAGLENRSAVQAAPAPAVGGESQAMATGRQALGGLMIPPAARKALLSASGQAAVRDKDVEEMGLYRNLEVLKDFDLLVDFDVLSELPLGEKKVAHAQRFQSLPPEQQERIDENLRRWNAFSPAQKEQIRERQEILASLSSAQRQEARALFPEWGRLEPQRRQAVLEAFRHLRGLPPDQRQDYLSSPEVQQQFSPEERQVLEGLSQLLPGSKLESESP